MMVPVDSSATATPAGTGDRALPLTAVGFPSSIQWQRSRTASETTQRQAIGSRKTARWQVKRASLSSSVLIFFFAARLFPPHALQTTLSLSSSSKKASSSRPATGARYRGNATRYALPRPKHAAAFAKLAALCGKVSAPRAVAESAKAMLRAVLSEQSAAGKGKKASSPTVAAETTPSPPPPPPPPLPALPLALLGGACLLLAARRERAPLFPADVAAALAVEPLRLARAAAAVAEAARAFSEGSAAPVGAEAFLRRELPGLVRGSSSWATASGGSGAAAAAAGFPSSSASFPSSSSSPAAAAAVAAASCAQTLEDALTLARWVEAGACPVECPAHGPTLAAGASVLAAAGRGVRLGSGGGDGGHNDGLAVVAAAFRLASAADVARSEAALRRGLCRLAAARLPWLRKIRAKDVEGHARALLAAAREATAEAEDRRRRHEEEEVRLRAAAAANKEGGDDALAASAAAKSAAVGSSAEEAQLEREDEEEDELAAAVIREEDWGLYLRRPEEVALAAVEFAAREKREAEAEAEAEGREENGVATPVQRPRKRACFVK